MSNASKSPASHIRLHVIPEPAKGNRSVINRTGEGTVVFKGSAAPGVVMECGSCSAHLTEGVPTRQIANLVLKCNACGAFNETVEG